VASVTAAPAASSQPPVEKTPEPHASQPAQEPDATTAATTSVAEAAPQPPAADNAAAKPEITPTADVPAAEAPVEAPPAAASLAAPSPAKPDAERELKLDPVAPQPAAATDSAAAGDSLGEAAADETPLGNSASAPAADENLPAVVEASPGDPAPLPVAEIQRRLGVGISRVDFSGVPLGHLAAFVSDVSGARVVLDETSLAKSGKSRKTPVTVKLSGGTAIAILEAAAEQAGLDYKIEPGRITLSARGP